MPVGCLQKLIFDAMIRMRERSIVLFGLSTPLNPRHMKPHCISVRNWLLCEYLNGFFCRPECPELLGQLADTTEDPDFVIRHYEKDGVLLHYQMYWGIMSPYANRGGLQ